jgi:uncharacterized membrane protein
MNKKGFLFGIFIIIVLLIIAIILLYHAFIGPDVKCSTVPSTESIYSLFYLCIGIVLLMIAIAYSAALFRPRYCWGGPIKEEKNAKSKHKLSNKK